MDETTGRAKENYGWLKAVSTFVENRWHVKYMLIVIDPAPSLAVSQAL
jgi:hypothetical protein